ncbi:MAG: T9SS type A sorting domain-containing protein [Bacteroidia bacterium]|nr:T9SS type A sorting domain-containing protein [Bacteroidia bacterium]
MCDEQTAEYDGTSFQHAYYIDDPTSPYLFVSAGSFNLDGAVNNVVQNRYTILDACDIIYLGDGFETANFDFEAGGGAAIEPCVPQPSSLTEMKQENINKNNDSNKETTNSNFEKNTIPLNEGTNTYYNKPGIVFNAVPNPFINKTQITFTNIEDGVIDLCIYNNLGMKIKSIINGFYPKGTYSILFDGSGFSDGMYSCILNSQNNIQLVKLIKLTGI